MTSSAATTLPFRVGEAASFGGLALVPLFPESEPRFYYIGLDEAIVHGLRIAEVDHAGSANDLAVLNPLHVGVLLYEGEELVGAKQNRVLDRPILVDAKSKTRIAVNCVERGHWSYRTANFMPAPREPIRQAVTPRASAVTELSGLRSLQSRRDSARRKLLAPKKRRRVILAGLDAFGKTESAGQRGIGEEGDLIDLAAAQGEHQHAPGLRTQVAAEGRLAVGAGWTYL